MCGRFYLDILEQDVRAYFHADTSQQPFDEQLARPRYNIGPGQLIWTVRKLRDGAGRSLDPLHWGLIPHFASDRSGAYKRINARAETVDRTPSFRAAFARRRCLVVAHGFYEWQKRGKLKQPFAIARKDGAPLAFAGIWENWLDKSTGEWLRSVAIVTTEASAGLRGLHDRMPVMLAPEAFARWLGEQPASPDELKSLLVPSDAQLALWPVDRRMNRADVDDPEVLTEVALSDESGAASEP